MTSNACAHTQKKYHNTMEGTQVVPEAFPAPSNKVQGTIDGVSTEAAVMYFEDKILVTLSQGGSLSQWVSPP